MFVGDLNLGEYYLSFGHGPGTFGKYENVFINVENLFVSADMFVGNLEASITNFDLDPFDPEKMVLKVDPELACQFKNANFKILQVANNHSIQHGTGAFQQSLAILDKLEISPVGLNQQKPVVFCQNNISIGFLAASDVPDNTNKLQTIYQRFDDEFFDLVVRSVNMFDHLIVMLHWGLESSTTPLPYQREISKKLKNCGVRAIIGSHPHLFYEITIEDNFICAYSLGNFVFDLCWDKRLTKTGILELEFSKKKVEGRVWPVELKEHGCLPVISGEPVPLTNNVKLYNHGSNLKWQQTKKLKYFLFNFKKGNTSLKIRFFKKKCLNFGKKFLNKQSLKNRS